MLKGALTSIPREFVPSKNSTHSTIPSASVASASIVIVFVVVNDAPLAGFVIEMLGGEFAAPWTVTLPIIYVWSWQKYG